MSNLLEVPYWTPAIRMIERGEEATGGPNGLANLQPQQLAARTLWLKQMYLELQQAIEDLEIGAGVDTSTHVQNFVVDSPTLTNKFVTLETAPRDPLKVELIIYGGIEQRAGVDFLVTGTTLSWSGLALELLLEEGSAFTVRFSV